MSADLTEAQRRMLDDVRGAGAEGRTYDGHSRSVVEALVAADLVEATRCWNPGRQKWRYAVVATPSEFVVKLPSGAYVHRGFYGDDPDRFWTEGVTAETKRFSTRESAERFARSTGSGWNLEVEEVAR